MNRWKGIVACFGLYCACTTPLPESPCQFTLDATRQSVPPSRGRGPFPGSAIPGHSAGFPVRLDLVVGTGKLERDGTTPIDFVITNIGDEPIKIPVSVDQNIPHTHVLTLYLTHASTRFRMAPGTHSLTAHAELLTLVEGRSELLGTADSISVLKVFSLESIAGR